ncbi:MAG: hypothetical protein D6778_09620, partial [Nitrospirae bacterium]
MRVFVLICLTLFVALPLLVFHLIPERTLLKGIRQIEENPGQGLYVSFEGVTRKVPAHFFIDTLKLKYKDRELLKIDDTTVNINPYLLYLRTLGFSADAQGGTLKASGLLSLDETNCCLRADSIPFKSIEASRYFGAVEDALFNVKACVSNREVSGKLEAINIKMKDLPYRDMVFPSSRLRSLESSFRIKGGIVEIETVKMDADGYKAVFYGTLKGRRLSGTLQIYADPDMPEEALETLKSYRVTRGL